MIAAEAVVIVMVTAAPAGANILSFYYFDQF